MKNLIIVVILMFSTMAMTPIETNNEPIETTTSSFCEGWEDGFCEGYKDEKGSYSICPITPLCPLPELNKDRYRDGYHRGFRKGVSVARQGY